MSKSVLIVGAGGFIGGFMAAEGLRRGYDVWCGVRPSTSRRFLSDPRLNFIEFDYDDPERLSEQIADRRWDYILYNLGATKCVNFLDFNRINYVYLHNFVDALTERHALPEKFVYISSLSAIGPGDEKTYAPLSGKMIPQPDTRYGLSKIKAETLLQALPEAFPWVILRPTGVYGPHEQDYLMMIKCIDAHFDFSVGYRKQMLTFIYVDDLARAAFDALESAPVHRKYILSEPRAYTQAEFRSIVAEALGRRFVIPVRLPLFLARLACTVSEKWNAARMRPSTLNSDKYRIMAQRNWNCDISPARTDWGFSPKVDLREGIRRTVEAYRTQPK